MANSDEDQPTDQLTALTNPGPQARAELEADERERDAHGADDYHGDRQADRIGAQCKADSQVVDAQRQTTEPERLAGWLAIAAMSSPASARMAWIRA